MEIVDPRLIYIYIIHIIIYDVMMVIMMMIYDAFMIVYDVKLDEYMT